jgi:hypothetical protein
MIDFCLDIEVTERSHVKYPLLNREFFEVTRYLKYLLFTDIEKMAWVGEM